MNKDEIIARYFALKEKYPDKAFIIDREYEGYMNAVNWPFSADEIADALKELNDSLNLYESQSEKAPLPDNFVSDKFSELNINMDLLNLRPYSKSTAMTYFDKIYNERKRIEKLSYSFIQDNNLRNTLYRQELNSIIYKFTQKLVDISDEWDIRKQKLEWFI